MLGKELAFETCMLLFAIGVEKMMLEHLKVQVGVIVKLDWNSPVEIHLRIDGMPP